MSAPGLEPGDILVLSARQMAVPNTSATIRSPADVVWTVLLTQTVNCEACRNLLAPVNDKAADGLIARQFFLRQFVIPSFEVTQT
ncbi:hypothetical protein HOT32_gp30 [Erwinia phage Faunus]|uniref:Uncharacterized protein n=1 Tax=Erwinia phage Faunus TaxID=2182346 RepID=A0A2U8UWR5_9CAUD|nr:hypothetical protein HOT32_gp30 [Erwinia phage Faunus]AWN08613.1 hypothetical protein [Erwinia phage Faunus]